MSNRDIFRIGYTVSSLLLSGQLALACDCARLTFEERIALSKVIFVGRVVEFEPIEKVSMVVEEVFKGDIEGIVTIPTMKSGLSCGVSNCDYFLPPLEPNLGERYRKVTYLQVMRISCWMPIAVSNLVQFLINPMRYSN